MTNPQKTIGTKNPSPLVQTLKIFNKDWFKMIKNNSALYYR